MNGTDSTLSFSTFCNIIDGASTTTTETRHGINPSTLEANPEVPISQLEDVDRAVKAARKAFGTWCLVPEEDRRKAVAAFAASLGEHLQDFATMLVKEQGRPVCLTIKRIYVHTDIYPQFLQAFSAVVESFKPGDGFAEGVLLGPIQNETQFKKIQNMVSEVRSANLKIVSGNTSSATTGKGYFIAPVVVDNPPDDAPVVTQEPFGPVIPLLTWSDEEDVIQRANDSKLGLGASVWTQDLDHGAKVARRLEAGSLWINNHMDLGSSAPFGGHKESGFGVEGGLAGIIGYCNSQTLYIPKK
ncbi:putative aldehyde dehydrogenase FUS7 [Colletotrichum fructicola]|nr:putative aldehyde dehydrogenase FUS7 [Colletotrichum fructicola]